MIPSGRSLLFLPGEESRGPARRAASGASWRPCQQHGECVGGQLVRNSMCGISLLKGYSSLSCKHHVQEWCATQHPILRCRCSWGFWEPLSAICVSLAPLPARGLPQISFLSLQIPSMGVCVWSQDSCTQPGLSAVAAADQGTQAIWSLGCQLDVVLET